MRIIEQDEWDALAYDECRRLDEEYGTLEKSPLHRSKRFPELWKIEKGVK